MSNTFPPKDCLTIEEAAVEIQNPKLGVCITTKTVRNYINNGLLDAKREINPTTGRVIWLITRESLVELPKRIKKRDEALRKLRVEVMQRNRRKPKND